MGFKEFLNEEKEVFVIYNVKTGKLFKGSWIDREKAKLEVKKLGDDAILSTEKWYDDNKNDLEALQRNAKYKRK